PRLEKCRDGQGRGRPTGASRTIHRCDRPWTALRGKPLRSARGASRYQVALTGLTSESPVMMCQRCGKACISRTEGRRVRLAGEDLFACNVCALRAVAECGGDRDPTPGAAQTGPADGDLRRAGD